MKSFILNHFQVLSMFVLAVFVLSSVQVFAQEAAGWKTGIDKINITPESSLWMAGYGNRDHTSEGKYSELWVKVLALEDAEGNQTISAKYRCKVA